MKIKEIKEEMWFFADPSIMTSYHINVQKKREMVAWCRDNTTGKWRISGLYDKAIFEHMEDAVAFLMVFA
jgi:hypothetical protein